MRRRVARSATRPRDPWSAAGALAGPAGRLVLECVAGASHIWSPWSCQPSRSSANGSSASSRTVSVQECIDLYGDFCQGSAKTVQRADAWRPTRSGLRVPNLDGVLFGLLAVVLREVVEDLHRAAASQGSMWPVVVVVVQPTRQGRQAGLVAGVQPGIGPLGGQGEVEAFGLAVGLGPIGAGAPSRVPACRRTCWNAWERSHQPLSVKTRSTGTPQWANQARARAVNPAAASPSWRSQVST
jgi:hypothetical protein